MTQLKILHQDEHYIAVEKPAGLLVHRTALSRERVVVLQLLRDQLGQHMFPVHRLDRPTSGALLFATNPSAARRMNDLIRRHEMEKTYLAVVRGYTDQDGRIDYPLADAKGGTRRAAITDYRRLATVELDFTVGRYASARYSLVEVKPLSGRTHQIRKHMAHIFHPIVGDTTHGEGRHNRLFREKFAISRLLLMATELAFIHPYDGQRLRINCPPPAEVATLFETFGWQIAAAESISNIGYTG